jgi:hypothetical protein
LYHKSLCHRSGRYRLSRGRRSAALGMTRCSMLRARGGLCQRSVGRVKMLTDGPRPRARWRENLGPSGLDRAAGSVIGLIARAFDGGGARAGARDIGLVRVGLSGLGGREEAIHDRV